MVSQHVNLYHYRGLASLAAQKDGIRDYPYGFDDEEKRSDSEDSDDAEDALTHNGHCYLAIRSPGLRRCKSLHGQDAEEERWHPRTRLSLDNVPRPNAFEEHARISSSIHRTTQLSPIAELEEDKRDEEVKQIWLKSLSAQLEQHSVTAPPAACLSQSKPAEPISLRRFLSSKCRRFSSSGTNTATHVSSTSPNGQPAKPVHKSPRYRENQIEPWESPSPRSHNCTNLNVLEPAQHVLANSLRGHRKRACSTASSSSNESGPTSSAVRSSGDFGNHNETIASMISCDTDNRGARKKLISIVRKVLHGSASGSGRTRSFSVPTFCHRKFAQENVVEKRSADDGFRPHPRKTSNPPTSAVPKVDPRGMRRDKKKWNAASQDVRMHNSSDRLNMLEDIDCVAKECQHHECKECGSRLVKSSSSDRIATMRMAIESKELTGGNPGQLPRTLADDREWDVEAAVQHRVVQVAFTVPKFELRVVNPDTDGSSITSITEESSEGAQTVLRNNVDPS